MKKLLFIFLMFWYVFYNEYIYNLVPCSCDKEGCITLQYEVVDVIGHVRKFNTYEEARIFFVILKDSVIKYHDVRIVESPINGYK